MNVKTQILLMDLYQALTMYCPLYNNKNESFLEEEK